MRLTVKRLEAILEALAFRLAGDLSDTDTPREDYENAEEWAHYQLKRRRRAK